MAPRRSWLEWLLPSERRSGERQAPAFLSAYFYWDGGITTPRAVRDLSATGMYLLTEQRWYPNTLINMTLARHNESEIDAARSIMVTTRVVRSGKDGVGLAFVFPSSKRSKNSTNAFTEQADKKTLLKFLGPSDSSWI